jgi:hypothetical protein
LHLVRDPQFLELPDDLTCYRWLQAAVQQDHARLGHGRGKPRHEPQGHHQHAGQRGELWRPEAFQVLDKLVHGWFCRPKASARVNAFSTVVRQNCDANAAQYGAPF